MCRSKRQSRPEVHRAVGVRHVATVAVDRSDGRTSLGRSQEPADSYRNLRSSVTPSANTFSLAPGSLRFVAVAADWLPNALT